jgi:glycosyltransferase involved in cell wall biosynthesis
VPTWEGYGARLPEVFRRVAGVHCVSESVKDEAVALGLDPTKAWVGRPGVDTDVFRPAENGNGGEWGGGEVLRLITVGWLRWEKGFEYALEAIRALVDRGVPVQLEVVGSVPAERRNWVDEQQRVLHTASDLELEDRVRLHGHATSAEICRRLQANDVLLHASVTEGIPAAVIEAMACGRPLVATRCGGLHEAVTDGVEGFLVPPRDPGQLAEAMLRLWEDPALRARMGQAGRRKVLADFTLEQEHEVFRAMYRQVTG